MARAGERLGQEFTLLGGGVAQPVEHQLQEAHDAVERGAQLVGGVGQELALEPRRLLELVIGLLEPAVADLEPLGEVLRLVLRLDAGADVAHHQRGGGRGVHARACQRVFDRYLAPVAPPRQGA